MPTWMKFIWITGCVSLASCRAHAAVQSDYDPWLQKPVLSYLYSEDNKPFQKELARKLHLNVKEQRALAEIAASEQRELNRLNMRPISQVPATVFNKRVLTIARHTDLRVRETLGVQYNPFRGLVRSWWNRHK